MKTIFVHAKAGVDVKAVVGKAAEKLLKKSGRVGLVSTIQFVHQLDSAKRVLAGCGIKAEVCGQILGCDASCVDKFSDFDAFLYIGSGKFHPLAVAFRTKKKVITADPFSGEVSELKDEEIKAFEKRRRAGLVKFLSSEKIGILVSTKTGQQNLKKALELKKKVEEAGDKIGYVFLSDSIDYNEFDNFNFVQCWVNTACPRIIEDYERIKKPIVNMEDVK